jgi:hypothetical protein
MIAARKPEIMSPAGYWPQLRTAIEAGADSVNTGIEAGADSVNTAIEAGADSVNTGIEAGADSVKRPWGAWNPTTGLTTCALSSRKAGWGK